MKGQGAQQKTNEEAAGVTQKDCRWIEIEAKESQDRAGESDRHDLYQDRTVKNRENECHHRGEQGRAGCKAVKSIDQI